MMRMTTWVVSMGDAPCPGCRAADAARAAVPIPVVVEHRLDRPRAGAGSRPAPGRWEDDRVPGQLRRSLGNLRRLDPALLAPAEALRVTLGVVLPLVIAVAVGRPGRRGRGRGRRPVGGVRLVPGRLPDPGRARWCSPPAAWRSPPWSAGPSAASRCCWCSLTALWALGAGLLTALGPPGTVIGLQCTVALIIVADFAMTPAAGARPGRAGPGRRPAADRCWSSASGPCAPGARSAARSPRRSPRSPATPPTAPRRGALPDADPFAEAATALVRRQPARPGPRPGAGSGRCSTSPSGPGWTSPPCAGRGPSSPSTAASADVVRRRRAAGLGRAGPHRHRRRPDGTRLPWRSSREATAGLTDPLRGGTAARGAAAPARGRGEPGTARPAAGRRADRRRASTPTRTPLTDDGPPPAAHRPVHPGARPAADPAGQPQPALGVVPPRHPSGGRAGRGLGAVHPAAAGTRLLGRPEHAGGPAPGLPRHHVPRHRAHPRHPGRVGRRDGDRGPAAPRPVDAGRAGGGVRVPVRGHASGPATRSSRRSSPATWSSSSR